MTGEQESVLFVYSPESTLKRRLESAVYPFSLEIIDALPYRWPSCAALLVFVPQALDMLPDLVSLVPVLACGPLSEMERAFSLGAADFLISPLLTEELKARAARLLYSPGQRFASLELSGLTLKGKQGRARLSPGEARFLETLLHQRGRPVSRAALRDLVWPDLDRRSRMPDITVSRLRKRFQELGAESDLIHTVKGLGYVIQNEP
jgi:DNA-binding response OmpR family regulator